MGKAETRDLRDRLSAPRIAVLGPVAIGTGPALQRVTGRPARVLVGLAASTRPLDLEQLSEVVWGDEQPATYRSALHVHLGSLRRLLAEHAAGCRIARVDDAYVLELGSAELDATLAQDLLVAARGELDEAPASSLELVEHVLALFRGTPFTADGEVIDAPSSHHLDALRLEAEEVHVEALLRTGQAARAETAALAGVEAEALREHRWGQLMRALYLSGRTADALATYQRARTALIEAIGIEPGRELRDLETAVLTHDVERLRLPRVIEDSISELPRITSALIGRDDEVHRVSSLLAGRGGVVLLGPPGVGKSRLALAVAHQADAEGVAWVDLRTAASESVGALLGDVPDWVRRHPTGLVVIDNVEVAVQAVQAAVTELERIAPAASVLVTSRSPLGQGLAVELVRPLGLPDPDGTDDEIESAPAVELLRDALRELAPAAQLPPTDAARIVQRTGGLPLVIRLRAAAARALPADLLIGQPPTAAGDEADLAVRAVTESLDEDVEHAFVDLSLLAGEFDADLGARLTALPLADRFLPVLVELVDHGLIQARPERPQPYSLLEPIRATGQRLLDASGRCPQVRDRHVDACIARAAALQTASIDPDTANLAPRLACDLPEHRRALEHLTHEGDAERALTLVCRLERPLYTLGWWAEKVELFDMALAIYGPPTAMRARAHAYRARPGPMHQFDLAHAERAEEIGDVLGQDRIVAYAKHLQSIGLWWLGEAPRAVELATEACEALTAAGRLVEAHEARKFLGVALLFAGAPEDGLRIQHEVLADIRSNGTAFNIAHNLSYLGHCHRRLGNDTAALADWMEARDLCRQVGNRGTAIHVDIGLAEVAVDRANVDLALERAAEALDLAAEARTSIYDPWAWTVTMRAHGLAGDHDAAIACAWRAIRGLPATPPGETVRLAIELAHLAVGAGDAVTAARLLGVAEATPDRRELPFPSPAEAERRGAVEEAVAGALGEDAGKQAEQGRRCTITEAAADLLVA